MAKALKKSALREIKSSPGRYFAILLIVALGVGFFSGLRVTTDAMLHTGDRYIQNQEMFDFRLVTTVGYEKSAPKEFLKIEGIRAAEGSFSHDVIIRGEDRDPVVKAHTLTRSVNLPSLKAGRLPEKSDEVLGDARFFSEDQIGEKIVISDSTPEENRECFAHGEYVLTGIADSVYYLNFERGTSSIGNGSVSAFLYLLPEGFTDEYYTEIFLKADVDETIYSDAYDDAIAPIEERLKAKNEAFCENRRQEIADEYDSEIQKAKDEWEDGRRELDEAKEKLEESRRDLAEAKEKLEESRRDLEEAKEELAESRRRFDEEYAAAKKSLDEAEDQLKSAIQGATLTGQLQSLPLLQAQLESVKAQRAAAEKQATEAEKEFEEAQRKIDEGEEEIRDAEEEIREGEEKIPDAEREIADGEQELSEAWQEILDAEEQAREFDSVSTYTLTRSSNVGYLCFENDAGIVEGISLVFPVFFFAVAALVCMTTMTRMVDDRRSEIGVMKAIGYSNFAVAGKFLFYSGSSALLGGVSGFILGTVLIPKILWKVYDIMYGFSDLSYYFDPVLAVLSLTVAMLCSVGATYAACRREFLDLPAALIRPKSPKAGKRIFLERIPFLWRPLSFLRKVSLRNIFRYKNRLIMMVLGIGGCTALLVAGFGINDSIKDIATVQFEKITRYDCAVSFKNALSEAEQRRFEEDFSDERTRLIFVGESSWDLKAKEHSQSATLLTFGDEGLFDYFDAREADGTRIPFPKAGEVLINEKPAKALGVNVGDTVTLTDGNMQSVSLRVAGIFKNYVYNYAVTSPESFREQNLQAPGVNAAYLLTDQEDVHSFAAKIASDELVSGVNITADMSERISGILDRMNYIVLLVSVCAAALAFIVLYNLSNINISERIREIATIKVLGFYPGEVSAYIFRENNVLTLFGAAAGLPAGVLLHAFVMDQIKIDMVSFDKTILPVSFFISFVMTFLFSFAVNLVMRRKMKKISMTESLKSVE